MTTTWAHLPNAKYIDQVLASVKAHPAKWEGAWGKAYPNGTGAARYAALGAALDAVLDAERAVSWDAALDAARAVSWKKHRSAARDPSWDAISAFIAYDDCAYMLESDVGELKILAAFGDPKAILLLPACIALSEVNALQEPVLAV